MIISIWEKIRNKICPKRLQQYGTLGLFISDDRSIYEKIVDKIEEVVLKIDGAFRRKRSSRKHVWHSYFDPSLGVAINSYSQIKEIERSGYTYSTYSEMEREAKKVRAKKNKEKKDKSIKSIMSKLDKVRQGRSYAKEIIEKARRK